MSTHSKKKYESIIADHFCQKNGWKSNWKYVHPQPVRTQRFGPHEGRCTNPATWRMGFVGRNVSVINKGPWADRFVFIPRSSGVGWLVVGDPFLPFFRILWLTQLINGSYALTSYKSWELILQVDPWGNTAGHSFVGNLLTYPFARLWWKILLWHHGMLHSGRTRLLHSSFPGILIDFHLPLFPEWAVDPTDMFYPDIEEFRDLSTTLGTMKNPGCFWGMQGLLLPSYGGIIS